IRQSKRSPSVESSGGYPGCVRCRSDQLENILRRARRTSVQADTIGIHAGHIPKGARAVIGEKPGSARVGEDKIALRMNGHDIQTSQQKNPSEFHNTHLSKIIRPFQPLKMEK